MSGTGLMLCSQLQLRKDHDEYTEVKLLPCRSWTCPECAPRRRKELMAIAASGEPTSCLTLTINTQVKPSIIERYKALHNAWKLLIKRILRQFALPPEKRWVLTDQDGNKWQELLAQQITVKVKAKEITSVPYISFAEATKAGEPHLHILMRVPYIPQNWISQQMEELIQSPVVWIEKIKGAGKAIAYVSKYVTKAPAQFGKTRRYWISKSYQLTQREEPEVPVFDHKGSRLVKQRYIELCDEVERNGLIPIKTGHFTMRLYKPQDALRIFGDGGEWGSSPALVGAWVTLGQMRRDKARDVGR